LAGEPDEQVLQFAFDRHRVILTEDFDFGELCIRLGYPAVGIVICAVKPLSSHRQAEVVADYLFKLGDGVHGALVTIEPGRMRKRPLGGGTP
jgi:predicted nuclease of predicted toxin-antitoxin system